MEGDPIFACNLDGEGGSQMWDPKSAVNLDGGWGGDPISAGNLDGEDPISARNLDKGGDPISAGNLNGRWRSHICRKPRWGRLPIPTEIQMGYPISAGNLDGW